MSLRSTLVAYVVACLMFLVLIQSYSLGEDENSAPADQGDAPHIKADWQAIKNSAEQYAAAFNAGDATKIAQLYTVHGELIDLNEEIYRGRETIEKAFAEFFAANPDAKIQIDVEEVHFPAPTLAIETGRTLTQLSKESQMVYTSYTAVHSKDKQGNWLLARVRDFELEVDFGAKLEDLNWLIGRWIDEDEASLLEIDCYWHPSGAYLMRDFKVRVEGLVAASGTERIGWDPLRKQIRSWLFDSEGGYLEAVWLPDGKKWNITAKGYRADGKPTEASYAVSPLTKDAYYLKSFDRFAGREKLPDLEMTIVKRPPEPLKNPTPDPTETSAPEEP